MQFDIHSVLITGTGMSLVFLCLSVFTWLKGRRRIAGLEYWFQGYGFFLFGMMLIIIRNRIPEWISIVFGNTAIFIGLSFKIIGLLKYLEWYSRKMLLCLIAYNLIHIALLVWSLSLPEGLKFRMISISLYNVSFSVLGSWLLLSKASRKLRSHTIVATSFYALYGAIYLVRTIRSFYWHNGNNWLQSKDPVESMILTMVIILLGGVAVGEMLLVHGKLELLLMDTAIRLNETNRSLEEEIVHRASIERELQFSNRELASTQKEIMRTLAEVVEYRSKETALHVARVSAYSKIIAQSIGCKEEFINRLADAAPMHDLGKVAMSDELLNKKEPLTAEEHKLMQSHTLIGYNLLKNSEQPLLQLAAIIALEHHEHWDGQGYPLGKKGEDISLAGRIVCLCDVFDALSVERPYKKAWDMDKILAYLKTQRGHMFDPRLVDVFFLQIDEIFSVTYSISEVLK
ncbi:HD domain-containing phosphohydrolase [Gracilinema caldarium]|uniref:HD domain-containing phosphohydrolase n=1 Tax=Gracilinema caldarium TaxID=215591 RepID=UPI0026EDC776|nr:HD domain-containing phosphohydrolase [Gracilinema caldarium]